MSAIITEKFRQHNATQFHESFSEASGNAYYLMIGKSSPFTTATSGGTDDSPPTPADDVTSEFYTFDSGIAAKKISTSNISFAIPRRDFSSSTVYDKYEHNISSSNTTNSGATNLFDSTFYFRTSANRVYKVLDNNSNSTMSAEPTSEDAGIITQDSYKLIYMYTITASEQQSFLTTDFMPVSTDSTVSARATDGKIEDTVIIASGGSGGTNGTHTDVDIRGDGTGGKATVTISGGAVTAVSVTTAGSGYTFATISDADIITAGGTDLSGSNLNVIIGPKGGHGSNAVEELGGHYVMLQSSLEGADGDDFLTANDFRDISLLVDPTNFGTSTVASATTLRNTYAMKFSGSPGTFQVDEKITQATTGAIGKVVEYDSTLKILYYVQERFGDHGTNSSTGTYVAFSGATTVTGASSGATGTPDADADSAVSLAGGSSITFTNGHANPEIQPDSGNVIYRESRKPISRATDQTEDIKIIVEF